MKQLLGDGSMIQLWTSNDTHDLYIVLYFGEIEYYTNIGVAYSRFLTLKGIK